MGGHYRRRDGKLGPVWVIATDQKQGKLGPVKTDEDKCDGVYTTRRNILYALTTSQVFASDNESEKQVLWIICE